MAEHEFGIMQTDPLHEKRYDEYEPYKYDCLSIHDDFIEQILFDLESMDCYWHTLRVPNKGLAYCGITLIPPKSLDMFVEILMRQNKEVYKPLIALANEAKEKQQYLIHFGI